ncbi:MAG: lytic murein transglycosylase B [Steroidobacteraceae bacterium]
MPDRILPAATLAFALSWSAGAAAQNLDITRPEVQRFIAGLSEREGMERDAIGVILRDAVPQKSIIELMSRPAERTLAWWEYRQRFLTKERIAAGLALWEQQRVPLERIARERGVPPEYLLAITGVETYFGRTMGRHRVLDALATLAFDYPPRSGYFARELEQYLLLARDEHIDPRKPLGSYAGAMGAPQFMPTSLRNFAVDGDGDGHRDLWGSWPDVFASIANYFVQHGWQPGEPVLAEATAPATPDDPATVPLTLSDTVESLRRRGYVFETSLAADARAMPVPAQLQEGLVWRVGFQNFYTITRYNRSALYAMAVHELAQALGARRRAAQRGAAGVAPGQIAPAS